MFLGVKACCVTSLGAKDCGMISKALLGVGLCGVMACGVTSIALLGVNTWGVMRFLAGKGRACDVTVLGETVGASLLKGPVES